MPVKQVVQDAFEQLVESGQSVAKSSVKQVAQTLNPWDMIKNSFTNGETSSESTNITKAKEQNKKNPGSTPLDFNSLQKNYAEQDKQKIDVMKNRLFQMVKGGEEKQFQRGKQGVLEKERRENWETEEKRKRTYEQQRRNTGAEPQGKERHFVMGGKKRKKSMLEPQPAEFKPATGHQ